MPLKHTTETLLVILLAGVLVLTGFIISILPPLSVSFIPWTLAFVASLLYPLSLYPMFKERRADYEFRAFHFAPAALLLLWMIFDLLASAFPFVAFLLSWFTWGWALPIIFLLFLLLVWFCFKVLRQWLGRLIMLAIIFLPFLLLGVLSEQFDWDRSVGMSLWGRFATGSGHVIADTNASSEDWREELRRLSRQRSSASSSLIAQNPSSSSKSSVLIGSTGSDGSASSVAPPPHLPHAGGEVEMLALMFVAGYCATLQKRAMRS